MDLKARLSSLEHQINALQARIHSQPPSAHPNDSSDSLNNLKQILIRLKEEHQSVLDSINQALRLVESSSSSSPLRSEISQRTGNPSSSPSSRLRDRISAACSTPPRPQARSVTGLGSSLLTPSVEKSHITFEILRDLENRSLSQTQNQPNSPLTKTKHVHFSGGNAELELSQASQEYLKKYNLLP